MTTRDVGDRINVQHLVYNAAGALTNATVVLSVTDPAGTITTPSVTNASTGTYTAVITLSTAGLWQWKWTASGTVVDVAYDSILATDPAPAPYADLATLKTRLGAGSSVAHDQQLQEALVAVSKEITQYCGRSFNRVDTASARLFYPDGDFYTCVDDFWTTTSLAIATDNGNDGTYETTWASTDYQLEPLNQVVDGEPNWPYYRIRAVGNNWFPCVTSIMRAPLQVTAKWGWITIPEPVRDACLILAEESFKLPDSPFGVGGYGPYGIVRVRENPVAARKLNPYRKHPVLVS